jgi:aryl-alcohol dehydrogenase-like predicted oxidoreductase
MAAEMGLGVLPWSPLASGVLAGKYTHADLQRQDGAGLIGSRREIAATNGSLTERGLAIADVVKQVAAEQGCSPSRVAIAWTLVNRAVTAPIIGARTLAQLEDNLGALEVELTGSQLAALDKVASVELGFPHAFLAGPMVQSLLFAGAAVRPRG